VTRSQKFGGDFAEKNISGGLGQKLLDLENPNNRLSPLDSGDSEVYICIHMSGNGYVIVIIIIIINIFNVA